MTDTKHSPLPWAVRPQPYDDWGLIRASNGSASCLARSPLYINEDALGVHRKNKTDPTEDNAQFIVTACNSYYENLETIAALKEALEEYMSQIGQGYAANGLPFTKYQEEADKKARSALAKVKP